MPVLNLVLFITQYDDHNGPFYDDIGADQLMLYCTKFNTSSQHTIKSSKGSTNIGGYIKWTPKHSCPENYYLVQFNQKVYGIGIYQFYSLSSDHTNNTIENITGKYITKMIGKIALSDSRVALLNT